MVNYNMKKIFFIFIILCIGCNKTKGPTEFYVPKNRVQKFAVEGQRRCYDVVFILNPPGDYNDLLKLIESYNQKTILRDTVQANYDMFERYFFKESKDTPRDFEDDESFSPDRLFDHRDDLIAIYSMRTCRSDDKTKKYKWWFKHKYFPAVYYKDDCPEEKFYIDLLEP